MNIIEEIIKREGEIEHGTLEIIVRPKFGRGAPQLATVTNYELSAKNGEDVVNYTTDGQNGSWAYVQQIDKVL
jgi:hypothetical protein